MPKVSIIVPVYNSQKYLDKCINSIINQTLDDIELLLINDGSSDESGKICDSYSEKDRRIKVIHKDNTGPGETRNVGIIESTGKYIGFVDSDDIIEQNMYERLYVESEKNNLQMAMCNLDIIRGTKTNKYPININTNCVMNKSYIINYVIPCFTAYDNYILFSSCNKLYKKDFIINSNIFYENRIYGEDWWFNIQLFTKYERIKYIDEVLYHYVIGDTGLHCKYNKDYFDTCVDALKKITNLLSDYNLEKDPLINLKFYRDFINQMLKIVRYEEDRLLSKELIKNIFINENVKDSCKKIISMSKTQLTENNMSRRNKILPYMILNKMVFATLFVLQSNKLREILL